MKTLLAVFLLAVAAAGNSAPSPLTPNVLRSVSGQFVVHDRRGPPTALNRPAASGPEDLELEPPFLVVSCERIKQALASELDADREWSGTINVTIRPVRRSGNTPQINIDHFGRDWTYKVEFPQRIDRTQFFRTLVQVLLLERANRTPSGRTAEIPLWLTEGFTQRLLASKAVELVLPPPSVAIRSMMVEPTMNLTRDPDPLARARQILSQRPPPSLAELSWPEVGKFSPADAEFYQVSSQLFVTELLGLKDGAARLREFIANLPGYYNWQTAFLQAYEHEFPNQLALEKWWALQAAHFAGRDNKELWTLAETAGKLDDLLHVAVAIRTATGELPTRTDISLQTVLREWDTVRQMQTLQEKISALNQAQLRVAPAYMVLVNDYREALQAFVANRTRTVATFGKTLRLPTGARKAALETIARLDALDARRQQLALSNALTGPHLRNNSPQK